MMTLEEAIKHCKDTALSCTNKECALEHFQLLKWLQEYSNMLETQGKHNPTNTVEPKFKVEKGKWYVCIKDLLDNYADKAFRKGDIYLSTQDGSLIPSNSNVPYKVVCPDMYFRDWTIQDAKDGDVLSYRDGQWIFIYKEKIDNNSFSYYTLYSTIYRDLTINDDCFTVLRSAIIPATKEQRYILMKAMADAGYTFDFEKKELKEIVQNSTEWSEDDERVIDDVVYYLEHYSETIQEGFNKQYVSVVIDKLKSLKNRVQSQPKQEFDENGYNRIIGFLKQHANSDSEVEKQNALSCINWLKSVIKHEEIIKYKIGDRVRFYSHSPVFTISDIDKANKRYISQSGDHISFYEELILVKSSINKDDIKCGDYLTTEDGTVIKVHDIDKKECVHYFYYASKMTEDGGDISNNFVHYCAILSDCHRATQEEIDFLEKWVAHKKYVWTKNNVSPYDEEDD